MDMLVLEEEKRLGVQSPALQKVKVSVEERRVCAQVTGQLDPRPAVILLPAWLLWLLYHLYHRTISTQGQERVRKTSLDLRREIIDVGGIQNLIELRKKRKQKKRDALAAAQEPPPEPDEIVRLLI